MLQFDEERQNERVSTLRKKEEENLVETLSQRHGIPYLDLSLHPINTDALRVIKESDARTAGLAVFNATDKNIDVAVLSPDGDETKKALHGRLSRLRLGWRGYFRAHLNGESLSLPPEFVVE